MPENATPLGDAVPEGDDATIAAPDETASDDAASDDADAALEERERTDAGDPPRLRDMRRARDRPPG